MKTIIQIILIGILAYLGQFFLPWWSVFIISGVIGLLIPTKGLTTFLAGFIAFALVWFIQVYFIDTANESILSNKVAAIFSLSSPYFLMFVTAAIGGFAGGFGALTGKLLGDLFKKKKERYSIYS